MKLKKIASLMLAGVMAVSMLVAAVKAALLPANLILQQLLPPVTAPVLQKC